VIEEVPETAAADVQARDRGRAPTWQRRLKLFAPLTLLVAVAAVWYFGELSELNSPEKISDAARSLRESPLALLYVVLAFVFGSLLFFPITALMAATALTFDALHGFLYAYVAALCAAAVTYWAGRLLGADILAYVRGPKIARFQELLRTKAVRASIAARFVPVGSFALLNMLAGSMHVPFRSYLLGNVIGILPGVAVLTLFADQLAAALRSADKTRLLVLAAVLVVSAGVWVYLRSRRRRAGVHRGTSLAE
jgi:phospholipase D1/2